MKTNSILLSLAIILMIQLSSCSPELIIAEKYYNKHEKVLTTIEKDYKLQYAYKPFAVAFTDKSFRYVSIEIMTDTLKYIYEFEVGESRLNDTLMKYELNQAAVHQLINNMRTVKCIWINMLDYYVEEHKNALVFIAIRPLEMNNPFTNKKYYILTFFNKQQYFDKEGNLLARNKHKRKREVNGDFVRRINDKVCYTISDRFR